MKLIELSQGKFAKVDDEDYVELSKYSWWYGSTKYAFRTIWIGGPKRKKRQRPMHRELLALTDSNVLVDHINGDKLDNQRSNLRLSNKSTNGCNRPKTRANTTGYKGVTKHNRCNRYISQITVNGKHQYLGLYETPFEAAVAYNEAALFHFGEYALLNEV